MEGKPDPNTQLEAWSRFVTTNEYVWSHLLGSIFGLGVYLAMSRAPQRVEMCFVALG